MIAVAAFAVIGQRTEEERSWNQPVEPFKIAGNIYYVGASDVTSYLITTPKGHFLIDSGFCRDGASDQGQYREARLQG